MAPRTTFLLFGLVAALFLVVAACGGDDDVARVAPAAPAPAAPAAPASAAPAAPAAPAAVAVPPAISPTRAPFVQPAVPAPAGAGVAMIKTGGTLRHFPTASVPNLDYIWQSSGVTGTIVRNFYDYPFGWDDQLQPQPQMVDTFSIRGDGMEYTFTLRDGLMFHDGKPVLAEDVTATILRWKESVFVPGKIWGLAEPTLEVVDDKTFKIKPTKPFGLWLSYWGQWPTFVMPKALVDSLEKEVINDDMTGSGPFKFVKWTPGDKVVSERFDAYVSRTDPKSGYTGARIAYVDFLEHIEVPDAGTKLAALQTGQGDLADGLPRDFFQTLQDTPGINTVIIRPGSRAEAATNKLYAPLNNPKSRLALVKISDPEEYMRAAYGPEELWETESCLFYCNSQWESYVGEEVYRNVDVAGAQVLWDEAVAETGFDGKMVLLTNPDYAEFYASALITKRNMETLGAEVDFVVTDWATVVGRKIANLHKDPQTEEGWHFYHTASSPFDPLGIQSMSNTWNGGWDNPVAQQLIIDFSQAASVQEAKDIVDELHRIWYYEDPATIMLGTANSMITMQDVVMGYVPHRTLMLDGLWLDR